MRQKQVEKLCYSCDIECSTGLTTNEKNRLLSATTSYAIPPNYHASCRMALLTADWRRIIQEGVNARTAREREWAAWCKQVGGEYCTWGTEWPR
jgi:hypothetical protein